MNDELPSGRTSLRLPPELRVAVDDEANRRGITVTELIIEALEAALPMPTKPQRDVQPSFLTDSDMARDKFQSGVQN